MLIDRTHPSHTRARTGIQRVARAIQQNLTGHAKPVRIFFSWAAVAAFAFLYLYFIREHSSFSATASDQSGYFNIAQRLLQGKLIQHVPVIAGVQPPVWNYDFQRPLGFLVDAQTGMMVPTYPVGFPLHLLAAEPFVSLQYATLAVNVCLVAASGILVFALGRELKLPPWWALAGVVLLWVCPLFVVDALQPMSDLPATVWTLAALWTSLKAHHRWPWGFAAGFAVGVAVLVRPTDLLVMVPVALALGFRKRAWIALTVGGLPAAAFQAWYNLTLYGRILTTGYGNVGFLFGPRFLVHNFLHFAFWIPALLSPFVVLPALGLRRSWRESQSAATALIAWAVVLWGFYLFYYHAGETWWYLRFILPIFPVIILASLVVVRRWCEQSPRFARLKWVPFTVLLAAIGWQVAVTHYFDIITLKRGDKRYTKTVEWMNTHAPADAIVLQMQMSGSFTYYTNLAIVRWDFITPKAWTQLQTAAHAAHRPIFATLFDFEFEDPAWKALGGNWQLQTRIAEISIWRLASGPDSPAVNSIALAGPQ